MGVTPQPGERAAQVAGGLSYTACSLLAHCKAVLVLERAIRDGKGSSEQVLILKWTYALFKVP